MQDPLKSSPPRPDPIGGEIEVLAATLSVPASDRNEGWRFGLPQLFLLVLAAAVVFGSSRAFGWEHLLCNGPLFLFVALLARGKRVEVFCLQVLIFSGILWLLWLWGAI